MQKKYSQRIEGSLEVMYIQPDYWLMVGSRGLVNCRYPLGVGVDGVQLSKQIHFGIARRFTRTQGHEPNKV